MKVRSIDNTTLNNVRGQAAGLPGASSYLYTADMSQKRDSVTFKGIDPTTSMIEFWAAMSRGGLAASFTVQDMLGTNFPRTFAALDRNKDLTGKNNYKAAVEVMIREFTTGPSMFVIPAIVLAVSSRLTGEANRVPTSNIADLSTIMKQTIQRLDEGEFKDVDFRKLSTKETKKAAQTIKKAFYNDVFTSIFEQYETTGKKVDINEYVKLMMKAESPETPKRNFFMAMFKKKAKVFGKEVEAKDEVLSRLASKFVSDKKAHTSGWGDFLRASVVKGGKEWNISDITSDIQNYSDDFIKQYLTAQRKDAKGARKIVADKFIETFKNKRIGTRCATNILMVVATGLFMSIIPKLYTRNKTNPETDAIYAQVNQQRKGASSEDK